MRYERPQTLRPGKAGIVCTLHPNETEQQKHDRLADDTARTIELLRGVAAADASALHDVFGRVARDGCWTCAFIELAGVALIYIAGFGAVRGMSMEAALDELDVAVLVGEPESVDGAPGSSAPEA